MLAITFVFASTFVSCGGKLEKAKEIDLSSAPVQTLEDMFAVQSKRGHVAMRMEAPLMEKFDSRQETSEVFPKGISVFGYTDDGLLESIIIADKAKHVVTRGSTYNEIWSAFGNVVIHNVIKQETMETDTIYWDRTLEEIYTDCYVKMYSPDGYMQGYGMRSDDHARNAVLNNPFNSYGVSLQDTTKVVLDSINFIGPFRKK